MAAVLAGGADAILAGRSAAAAFGFMKPSNRIEVCRPTGRPVNLKGMGPHHRLRANVSRRSLGRTDRTRIGPIPTSTVPWIMIELVGTMPEPEFRPVFIEAGRLGFLGRGCLESCRNRSGSFRGAETLRRLIEAWGPHTGRIRSVLEGEFRLLCGEFRVPRPETNQPLVGYEVDCLWRRERVVAELDGRRFHDDPVAFELDRIKGNALTAAGFTVIRLTWGMLQQDRAGVARLVLGALERGATRSAA